MAETNIETNLEAVYAAHIGIDWADKLHAIALREGAEGKIEESWLESDPESVHTWARSLGARFEGAKIAVGVELSKGALIEELRHYNFIDIYPLNPATTCRYRGLHAKRRRRPPLSLHAWPPHGVAIARLTRPVICNSTAASHR